MNLMEAKNFFKQYGGFHFHMGREEPDRYRRYLDLGISEETEDEWRENLVEAALDLTEGADDPIPWLRSLNDQLRSFHRVRPDYCLQLLESIRALQKGTDARRAAALKLLAGSTPNGKSGALYTLRQGGIDKKTLQQLVDGLADFTPAPDDNFARTQREEGLKSCRLVLAKL